MEQNVADNTVVKKPHACDHGAAEAVAAGAGAEAAGAGVGAEASTTPPPPLLPSAGERSKTDVEQGKSQAKSSSPLKERLSTFFTHGLLAKAKQVTRRLCRSPNKKHSKSEEGNESHSEASPQKKTPQKNKKPDEEDETCGMKKDKSSDDDCEVTFKLRQL